MYDPALAARRRALAVASMPAPVTFATAVGHRTARGAAAAAVAKAGSLTGGAAVWREADGLWVGLAVLTPDQEYMDKHIRERRVLTVRAELVGSLPGVYLA